jgi:HAD superfamily hydrolase (TIGR01549 family)
MYQLSESCWYLEPDALETLKTLKSNGYRLGLITNAANAPDSNRLIDKFQLRGFFDAVLISAEEKIRKPDTRNYSRAMQKLEISPNQAAMVGDTSQQTSWVHKIRNVRSVAQAPRRSS